jgi:hypothetical protein
MRSPRAGLTRWEVALAVVLGTVVWNVAEPPIRIFMLRTRRAEAGMVLEALQAHLGAGGAGVSGSFPRSEADLGPDKVPWSGGPAGFTPPASTARCSYRVDESGPGATAHATCDVDGDGVPARYQTAPDGRIMRLTDAMVF